MTIKQKHVATLTYMYLYKNKTTADVRTPIRSMNFQKYP